MINGQDHHSDSSVSSFYPSGEAGAGIHSEFDFGSGINVVFSVDFC